MRPAPIPNDDETLLKQDLMVADPLGEGCDGLLRDTARRNREILTLFFRPVPTNLVRNWGAYDVRVLSLSLFFDGGEVVAYDGCGYGRTM